MNALSQRTHHAKFYFPQGSHVFAVGSTLYKLHTDFLGYRGGALHDLTLLPQSQTNPEGLSDLHPILLPQLTEQEFEHYLEFVYDSGALPPFTLRKLVNVLKVSSQWQVDNGRNWAIYHLDRTASVPASLRLELALRYDVSQWVEPAFHDLVFKVKINDLQRKDFTSIGYPAFALLMKVREAIEKHRRVLAYLPLPIEPHDPSCTNTIKCAMVWKETWWMKVGHRLLDPESELPFSGGLELVRKVEWVGMTPACREQMIRIVAEAENGFQLVEQIFAEGLESLSQCGATF